MKSLISANNPEKHYHLTERSFMSQSQARILLLCLCSVFLITFSASSCLAKSAVSGRYTAASGTQIVLSLSVNTSGPTNLIVDQAIGAGNSIVSTSPSAQKINASTGQIKWLFRNVNPGQLTLSIRLKSPLKGKPRATVKYRAPGNGGFEELRISP